MAETLEAYLSRQFRDVSETGKSARTVRLVVAESGQMFDRWDAPLRAEEGGPGPKQLAEEIEDICKSYADSFPSKGGPTLMAIVVEDGEGNERGRHLKKVIGTSTAKLSLGSESSLSEGARQHVETTKILLNASAAQVTLLTEQIRLLMETVHAQSISAVNDQMKRAEQAVEEADAAAGPDANTKYIVDRLTDAVGPLVELFGPRILAALNKGPGP